MEFVQYMDETPVRISRAGDRGWAERGPKVNFIGEENSLVTVNIAVGAVEGVRHQIIFGGKPNGVHIAGPSQVPASDAYGIALELHGHSASAANGWAY